MGYNDKMTTFLKTIANNSAGTVMFSLPDCETLGSYHIVEGFLAEDPQISFNNEWGTVGPDLSMLNDFTQLMGMGTYAHMAGTNASWKNTAPISVNLNFYLLTYSKDQLQKSSAAEPITQQASYFAQLTAVQANLDTGNTLSRKFGVKVHGGYSPGSIFEGNDNFTGTAGRMIGNIIRESITGIFGVEVAPHDLEPETDGTVQIIINGGGRPTIVMKDMLLASVNFTPSTVRTGYWANGTFITSGEPLYIKVSASFRLSHMTTVEDARRVFRGGANV